MHLLHTNVKVLIIIVLCAVIGLGALLFRQNATIVSQETKLAAVDAELSALKQQSKSVSLDLQVKCSEQAHKTFVQSRFNAGYENHYNAKLKKCFIDMQDTTSQGKEYLTNRYVSDAIEGKLYGTYAWHSAHNKKYWEVPPTICEVESLQGEKQRCNSEEEFSKLVQVYMAE